MTTELDLIDREGRAILDLYFQELRKYDGRKCENCGVVQASPMKGFQRYYCVHVDAAVCKKTRSAEKQLWTRMMVHYDQEVGGRG